MKVMRTQVERRENERLREHHAEAVLVVDQSPIFAEALARLLSREGLQARHASFSDASTLAKEPQPALLLLDGDEQEQRVLGCASEVVNAAPGVRILLVVRASGEWTDTLADQAGALGCVNRTEGAAALLEAIRHTHSGRLPRCEGAAVRRWHRPSKARRVGPLAPLTQRELEILEALARGLRDPAIARDLGISSHTVRTHVQNILTKLEVHTRHQAVTVALRAGVRPAPSS